MLFVDSTDTVMFVAPCDQHFHPIHFDDSKSQFMPTTYSVFDTTEISLRVVTPSHGPR